MAACFVWVPAGRYIVTEQLAVVAASKDHVLLDTYVDRFVNRHRLRVYVCRVS
jgi:hypothetical protein